MAINSEHTRREMASRPSFIKNGMSANAAMLSSHHHPSNQVAAKPTIKTIER
jgi:hypothetical protein